jgi:hydrogenase-4 component B
VAMPVLLLGVLGLCAVPGRGRMLAVRRVPAWRSATGGVAGENQYTPFGFASPTRKLLANQLLNRSELTVLERETAGRVGDPHRDAAGPHLHQRCRRGRRGRRGVPVPPTRPCPAGRRPRAKRLQSGRLDAIWASCSWR